MARRGFSSGATLVLVVRFYHINLIRLTLQFKQAGRTDDRLRVTSRPPVNDNRSGWSVTRKMSLRIVRNLSAILHDSRSIRFAKNVKILKNIFQNLKMNWKIFSVIKAAFVSRKINE